MGWADNYIKQLEAGMAVSFRPRGNSMVGLIESGQLVTVSPYLSYQGLPDIGTVVLCKVRGRQYLHKVLSTGSDGRVEIGNNKGGVNGWTKVIYGRVVKVED